MKHALFIGRWQPPHPGHEWLIRQKLDQGVPVLIAVRPTDEFLETERVIAKLYQMFPTETAEGLVYVFPLPRDIESVNYGRDVGYEVVEHVPPTEIGEISASQLREQEGFR